MTGDKIDDGGAVVASLEGEIYRDRDNNKRTIADIKGGVSLRDWFAGQALTGILAGNHPIVRGSDPLEVCARVAYEQADAMLKARKP